MWVLEMQVAVRSEEPYRLQAYSVLASLDTSYRSSEPDMHGIVHWQNVVQVSHLKRFTATIIYKLFAPVET